MNEQAEKIRSRLCRRVNELVGEADTRRMLMFDMAGPTNADRLNAVVRAVAEELADIRGATGTT